MSTLLPPEIWMQIIRWATLPPTDLGVTQAYLPFRVPYDTTDDSSIEWKRNMIHVCRLWRALATPMLYEDIRVIHSAHRLAQIMEDTRDVDHGGYGQWVRRLVLPYASTETPTLDGNVSSILGILRCCQGLECLIRPISKVIPGTLRYEFSVGMVPLLSLKRLEWWHYNDAARSGGINSLVDVLENTPNLQHLAVGGNWRMSSERILELAQLTTLRLRRIDPPFVRMICRWKLPALTHVIADFAIVNVAVGGFWETFGHRLTTLELGRTITFLLETDQIAQYLRACPNLTTLNYAIHFTQAPRITHPHNLRCIGVYAAACPMLDSMEEWARWNHLNGHLNFISSPLLPDFRTLVFYGSWQATSHDIRFANSCRLILPERISVIMDVEDQEHSA
ncbi:hypothetical protein BJ138DRAFT_1143161 [Hygrophoropsis aurantiaca]|uniref:Uncharacterized protein n=1 Tax=Hygrophoropsis aurantiaca TaxID=72124 RepID=A0ACB8ANG8_9AGAM|nr:hypothetical protein BJ138DRAFT_1143161 [Hygrophoropsis aurantiaca]